MADTVYDTPKGPITVKSRFYLASCDGCGWIGSSEQCGVDSGGDDSDVYCPECSKSGADLGKAAAEIETAHANRPVPQEAEHD
jgi:hypothetical protein